MSEIQHPQASVSGVKRPRTAGVPKPDQPPVGPSGISPRPGTSAPEFAGFVVAYDLAGPDRNRWFGTDLGFPDRAEAVEALAERRAMWPGTPFVLYGLVPVVAAGDLPC